MSSFELLLEMENIPIANSVESTKLWLDCYSMPLWYEVSNPTLAVIDSFIERKAEYMNPLTRQVSIAPRPYYRLFHRKRLNVYIVGLSFWNGHVWRDQETDKHYLYVHLKDANPYM